MDWKILAQMNKKKNKEKMKKMTTTQKYASLKRQTEQAGMTVSEQDGRLVVSRRKKKS